MGAIVLIVAIVFLGFAYSASQLGDESGYELIARFDRVDGLQRGSDVRISGIKVGTVVDQTLDPATYRAEVRFTMREDVEVPADSSVAVVSDGLLGGKYLSLVPGGDVEMLARRRRGDLDPVGDQSRGSDRPLHLQPGLGRRARARVRGRARARACGAVSGLRPIAAGRSASRRSRTGGQARRRRRAR